LNTRLAHELYQRDRIWEDRPVSPHQSQSSVLRVIIAFGNLLFGFYKELVGYFLLSFKQIQYPSF